jgi:hypothetical protein
MSAMVRRAILMLLASSAAVIGTFLGPSVPEAFAAPCTSTGTNYFISGTPSLSVSSDDGASAAMKMYNVSAIDLGFGDHWIESIGIFHAADSWLAYGISIEHNFPFTNSLLLVDYRLWDGVYAWREHDTIDTPNWHYDPNTFSVYRIAYRTDTQQYDFLFEGVTTTYHRAPPWRYGQATGHMETYDTCNTGISSFRSLKLRWSSTWLDWTGTSWCRDTEPNWGFDYVSATAYTTSARTDNFTGTNSSHC